MDVAIEKIGAADREKVLIRCHAVTEEVREIEAFVKSRQGRLSGTRDRKQYEVAVSDVYYIESVDKRTFVYTKDDCYESRDRLYELEEKLGTYCVRISKSMIVNLRKIRNVSAEPGARMVAVLLNGERVVISRSYVKDIKRRLGIG